MVLRAGQRIWAIYRVLEQVPVAALGGSTSPPTTAGVLGLSAAPLTPTVEPLLPPVPGILPGDAARGQHARSRRVLRPVDRPNPAGQRSPDRFLPSSPSGIWRRTSNPPMSAILPYSGLQHLREWPAEELNRKPGKPTKVIVRNVPR